MMSSLDPLTAARPHPRGAVDGLAEQAASLAESGDLTRAAALWRDLISVAPEDRRGHVGAAESLRLSGACAEADAVLLAAAVWFPEDFDIDLQFAWVGHSAGDTDEAMRRWERLCRRHPDNPAGAVCAALSLRALGRADLADAMLAPALDRFAGNADVAITYAWTAQITGDWGEAMARWEIVRERHPGHADGFVFGAAALRAAGLQEEAARMLALAEAAHPGHPELAIQKALAESAAPSPAERVLPEAWRLTQTGDLRAALDRIDHAAWAERVSDDGVWLRGAITRRLAPAPASAPELLWRSGTRDGWEGDWVRHLLGESGIGAERDFPGEITGPRVVVVDNLLSAEKGCWYRRLYRRGVRVTLVHLSDEAFVDDLSAYRWCHAVLRTYWSPLLARLPQVHFIPLGTKSGFANGLPARPASARRHMWSFAGDPNKSTRAAMLAAMGAVPGGATHLTSGFGAADALSVEAYRALFDASLFIPCPTGFTNLDSFRVWEALEAGCIPIVERREGFDYFREMMGAHPMPTVSDWREVPALIFDILAPDGGEAVRRACETWWTQTKQRLARQIAAIV